MLQRLKSLVRRTAGQVPVPVPDPDALRVLMVCMGNICRSPIAEGVLRTKLLHAGLQRRVVVDSAGTSGMHGGEPPDPRGIRRAAARGYEIGSLRARGVIDADFQNFDLILAMDSRNLKWLRDRAPAASSSTIGLLLARDGARGEGADVPDPYYGAEQGFDHVLDLVEEACDGLVRGWGRRPSPDPWVVATPKVD